LSTPLLAIYFSHVYPDHRYLHSFPTRRSSDLHRRLQVRNTHGHHVRDPAAEAKTDDPHVSRAARVGFQVIVSRYEIFKHLVPVTDRKSTRLNSSHVKISYAVFCLKKKKNTISF